jgi:hypothetical protein
MQFILKMKKITAGHIEIIFTHDCNNTVSMWNHLEKDESGVRYDTNPERYTKDYQNIANTDSANYADPKIENGKYVNSGEVTIFGCKLSTRDRI